MPSSCFFIFLLLAAFDAFDAVFAFFGSSALSASASPADDAMSAYYLSLLSFYTRYYMMSSGIAHVPNSLFAAISYKRASPCLHGNCLLGHEQRHTGASGSIKSTDVI